MNPIEQICTSPSKAEDVTHFEVVSKLFELIRAVNTLSAESQDAAHQTEEGKCCGKCRVKLADGSYTCGGLKFFNPGDCPCHRWKKVVGAGGTGSSPEIKQGLLDYARHHPPTNEGAKCKCVVRWHGEHGENCPLYKPVPEPQVEGWEQEFDSRWPYPGEKLGEEIKSFIKSLLSRTKADAYEKAKGCVPGAVAYHVPRLTRESITPLKDVLPERMGAMGWNDCREEMLSRLSKEFGSDGGE